jgi:phosphatidate cytidylyltransferase
LNHIPQGLLTVFIGIFVVLVIASIITFILTKSKPDNDFSELVLRIKSWWMMAILFSIAILINRNISILFFAFLSFLALKEYFTLIPTKRAHRLVLFFAYLSIPVQFYWIYMNWYGMFIIFIPVYMFLLIPLVLIFIGENKGFLRSVGSVHWGMMMMLFGLSHISFLLVLPPENAAGAGGAGLILYLVVLTQGNDVAQYLWGKLLGKHKVVPKVSPNKTWEGLLGGVATTIGLAYLLAPFLTPLSPLHILFSGIIIGLGGFIGDVNISALKRDIGVKDSGTTIPGHGGILDRIDSLTFTAPMFFHFIRYLYF